MMALGAVLAALLAVRWPGFSRNYALAAAAGLIAGESMTGVGASFWQMFRGS
jgi:ABC-type sugar transport system substrate-binding protein